MATLTLGKSVTIDAVQSKKGDAVFACMQSRLCPLPRMTPIERITATESPKVPQWDF